MFDWIAKALTNKGQPSSTRLNAFCVMVVLSVISLMLTCKLVFGVSDPVIGNTLDGICLSLAGLGGVAYVGGRIADRAKKEPEVEENVHKHRKRHNRYTD